MAVYEKYLSGAVSSASLTGDMGGCIGLSGNVSLSPDISRDYEKLINKPKINGVELIQDKSFEELGSHAMTNFEILELMKKAGF